MELKSNFRLTSVSNPVLQSTPQSPYAPIDILIGKWEGKGFNQIWRPFFGVPGQDRFLELNETIEQIEFEIIPGDVPNRGLLQADINLKGIRYLQSIQDANALGPNGEKLPGIHIENGMWLSVPATNDLDAPRTVARTASIPHGTAFVAQGFEAPTINSAPPFSVADITPFVIGDPSNLIHFPESVLANPTQFRTPLTDIPNVTQSIVDDPNTVLANDLKGLTVLSTSTLIISTTPLNPPPSGGGTANIAFLEGIAGNPNAQSAQIEAIFWVEKVKDAEGQEKTLLQYSQTVLLNFNGLSWPHISVATLVKQ